jgi:hypothetical protein
MGWVFAGGANVATVSPIVRANVAGLSYLFIPLFTTQGVLTGMMDALLQQRLALPEAPAAPVDHADNPWRLGLINVLRFGVPWAVLAYLVAGRDTFGALTPAGFAWRFAMAGCALCAITAWVVSGTAFTRETRVPREQRPFRGDATRYAWSRHVWPHTITNAVINCAVAFALFPLPIAQAGALVPAQLVVGDTFITFVILIGLIAGGVSTHVRVDRLWGIALPSDTGSATKLRPLLLRALLVSTLFTVAIGMVFWATGTPGLGVYAWAAYRGVVFGVFPAWLARSVVRVGLQPS